jgi:hypothetical protein
VHVLLPARGEPLKARQRPTASARLVWRVPRSRRETARPGASLAAACANRARRASTPRLPPLPRATLCVPRAPLARSPTSPAGARAHRGAPAPLGRAYLPPDLGGPTACATRAASAGLTRTPTMRRRAVLCATPALLGRTRPPCPLPAATAYAQPAPAASSRPALGLPLARRGVPAPLALA